MAISDSSAIILSPFILPQMKESHRILSLDERNVSLGDNVQVERTSAFFKLIERNLGIQKGTQSHLQILLKHAVQFSDSDANSPVIAAMKQAFFKQKGYLARFFSNETWEEWTENRTALGKVATTFMDCIASQQQIRVFVEKLDKREMQQANNEAKVLLKNIRNRTMRIPRNSDVASRNPFQFLTKNFCGVSWFGGITASIATKNPLPFLLGLSECFPRVYAQQKVGTEFQVNTYTNNNQGNPSVTSFINGNFVVTSTLQLLAA